MTNLNEVVSSAESPYQNCPIWALGAIFASPSSDGRLPGFTGFDGAADIVAATDSAAKDDRNPHFNTISVIFSLSSVLKIVNPLEKLYSFGNSLHRRMTRSVRIPGAKILSIGNITTGGTGKTPATIYFSKLLRAEFPNQAVLSRGYGGRLSHETNLLSDGFRLLMGSDDSGDEPYLMAVNLPGVKVAVGRNRLKNAQRLVHDFGTSLFLLDDGFQHYRIGRDADVVLIDVTNPFGSGRLLPQGILREPVENLNRASAIVLTKTDLVPLTALEELREKLQKISGLSHIFISRHASKGLVKIPHEYTPQAKTHIVSADILKHESVWALSAIANSRAFEEMLRRAGAESVTQISFRDHHDFSARDIEMILSRVKPYDLVVTTEKDYVRLRKHMDALKGLRQFYYLKIEFEVLENEILLKEGLKARLMNV
ncbi:MAG: tetraacyldisaccharide 4'-kinase [Leptospiraceae bacterium]|nr:tetraacyldisaccharide 4'-kinase [Leptospiraceae bacterium]